MISQWNFAMKSEGLPGGVSIRTADESAGSGTLRPGARAPRLAYVPVRQLPCRSGSGFDRLSEIPHICSTDGKNPPRAVGGTRPTIRVSMRQGRSALAVLFDQPLEFLGIVGRVLDPVGGVGFGREKAQPALVPFPVLLLDLDPFFERFFFLP